jgi:16S rRNA (guanine527-N7)-methyltransferase
MANKFNLNTLQEIDHLLRVLREFEIPVPENAAAKLAAYTDLIRKWNRRTQLVSRNDEKFFVSNHIAECLATACVFDFQKISRILDFGSGAGLPGIPLAVLFPKLQVALLEPKRKRALFLRHACSELALENTKKLPYRSEEIPASEMFAYDAVIARAVASLEKLWTWAGNLLAMDGMLMAMKGGDLDEEIQNLKKTHAAVKPQIFTYPEKLVPQNKNRKIVVIQ